MNKERREGKTWHWIRNRLERRKEKPRGSNYRGRGERKGGSREGNGERGREGRPGRRKPDAPEALWALPGGEPAGGE